MKPLKTDPRFQDLRERSVQEGLTPKELASLFGGSRWGWTPKRIRALLRRGRIPAVSFGGRWYIDKDWAQNYLEKLQAQRDFDSITEEEDEL